MAQLKVVAVGASAGGVEALRALVAGLPVDFPAAVLVVLHLPRDAPSALPTILDRSGPLPARTAVDGEVLRPGQVYVAAVNRHLLVVDGRVRLSQGPAENGHRPAVDPLFRSVARAYGRRAVGVVLSGSRDDGAAGLGAIVEHGGTAVVQDPEDALHQSMPRAALDFAPDARVAPAAKLGGLLVEVTSMDIPESRPVDGDTQLDAEVAMADLAALTTDQLPGKPAGYGCPSCGGGLFELASDPVPRYRCRVGHAWSPETLLDEQAIALESALWMALRALEEKSELSRRMAASTNGRGTARAVRFSAIAEDADNAGTLIRELIGRIGTAGSTGDR